MENEKNYYDDAFVITLTLPGTQYEEVEVEVTNPMSTISDQINRIVEVFELPKMDNGGVPIRYLLGQIVEEGEEPTIFEFMDDEGRELTLADYNVQPGDHLELTSEPIAG
jgi:hypothetical protein